MKSAFQIGHGEVRISSARSNSSKWAIALQPHGQVWRYDIKGGSQPYELPREVRTDTQAVFSRFSPDHIFTINDNQIWQHDLRNGGFELVASFPQYELLSAAHAEGDLTPDGWLALCGIKNGTEHAFCYNLHTKQSGAVVHLAEPIDGLKAAIGGWLLVSGDFGIRAYRQDGSGYLLTTANGHACTAVWNGRPQLIWLTAADAAIDDNAIAIIDIETGNRQILKSFDWAYSGHVSASETDVYASVYDPPNTTVTKGLPYQIWRLPFDRSGDELLFEYTGPYHPDHTPRASYSDGHVLFTRWNGEEDNVWAIRVDDTPRPVPFLSSRIDYSVYVGKKYWEMWPRADGALDIIEKLVTP